MEHKNRARCQYIESIMYMEDYQINETDMQLFLTSKDKNKEEKEEEIIPAGLIYGVTIAFSRSQAKDLSSHHNDHRQYHSPLRFFNRLKFKAPSVNDGLIDHFVIVDASKKGK